MPSDDPTPDTRFAQQVLAMLGIAAADDDPRLVAIANELAAQTRFAAMIDTVLAESSIPAEAVANAVERFDPAWAPVAGAEVAS